MYRTSDEPRFAKKKQALQRAFIDLTLTKQTTRITVKELTEHAGVNRMTFYSHYDEVSDILREFVDETVAVIMDAHPIDKSPSIKQILQAATEVMEENLDFYRLVAQDERFEFYRMQFRKGFTELFVHALQEQGFQPEDQLELTAGMLASGVTYAYLDWLAGRYNELPLEDLVAVCERFVSSRVS